MKLISLLLLTLALASAFASNYPHDYCHQNIRLLDLGPVLVAQVQSGCMGSKLVLGLKNRSMLSQSNVQAVDAVITTSCENDGSRLQETHVLKLDRDWDGNGFLSGAQLSTQFIYKDCAYNPSAKIKVAFTDGVQWDNNGGGDYEFTLHQLSSQQSISTNSTANDNLSRRSWELIIEALQR